MAYFMFVDPYSLSRSMTSYSSPRTTPLTCLEFKPHYATLIAHAPHFPGHPWYFTTDQDGCTSMSYIWLIIHPYYLAHLHHFIHLTNPTWRPTNGAPALSENTIPPCRSPLLCAIHLHVCTFKSHSYSFGKCTNIL